MVQTKQPSLAKHLAVRDGPKFFEMMAVEVLKLLTMEHSVRENVWLFIVF